MKSIDISYTILQRIFSKAENKTSHIDLQRH